MPFIRRIVRQRMVLSLLFIFAFTVNFCSLPLFAAEVNEPVRVRIFPMRNITAQQGKDFLAASKLSGSAVVIPGTTALSVTSDPQTLVYAGNLLKLVDQNEPYEIKFFTLDAGKQLPVNEAIAEKLGLNFNVGTLLEGNASSQAVKVIIDTIGGQPVIVAPKAETQTLIKIVNELAAAPASAEVQTKTSDANLADVSAIANSEPNFAVEMPAVVEANEIKADEAAAAGIADANFKASANDVDGLNEFMNELAVAAKAEKEKQQEAAKLDEQLKQAQAEIAKAQMQAEAVKPVEQSKLEETVKLTPEVNEVLAQTAKVKTPAVNEVNIPNRDEVLELNLPEKLEIVTLIELVGKYLNLNYLYDETKVMGAVSIKVQGKIRVGELYSLLESVLKFKNLAMSRKGNLVTIVPVAEALDQDPVLVDGDIKPGDIAVTKVMRLKYISTDSAQNLLAQMKLGSNITPIKEISTLVITEYAFRMQRIEDLLALVDVPGEPKDFKLRVLKYTIAESLVTKIKALAEQLGTVDITVGATSSTADSAMAGRIARPVRPVPQPGVPTGVTTGTGEVTSKSVYVDFDKRTNRILMIGLPTELSAVDKIIDSLDVPQQDLRTIREYEIQFIDIVQIVDALKELNIIEGTSGTTGTGTSRRTTTINRAGGDAVPQPQVVQQQMAGGESATGTNLLDQPQVVMLEATNSLLINATPEQHTQISQIIAYIDREPVETAIPYRIYRLENQDPEKLAETLNSLIEKTVKDKEGKIQQTVKYTEDNIVIVPDVATFSVIVYASKKNQDWIGNLIKTLDTRRPQVLIDVSLVEVTKTDAFEFDLDFVTNAKDLVTNNIGSTTTKFNAALGDHLEAKFDSGTSYGYYSADRIQALLKLVDTKGYGRVLAQPKILVNDNEEGTIETTNKTYVSEKTQSFPGTSTTSDTPVVTETWKDYSAKIKLAITPQISEGELLRLEIEMTREDFGKQPEGAPPDMTTSNVKTVVTVPDGSTIILGGLNKLNQAKGGGKTPLLGDIPVAGGLFRKVDNSNKESRLYVFVKANISRPDARSSLNQLKQISKKNQIEFERHEEKFQKHQSFPGIDDRIIEPAKILEQDDANTVEIK